MCTFAPEKDVVEQKIAQKLLVRLYQIVKHNRYYRIVNMIKAALFDLDGVVFETESQYSIFWGMIGREYHPEIPDFEYRIKGQTLVQIYDKYFSEDSVFAHIKGYTDVKSEQDKITTRLNEFEKNMSYPYITGFEDFIKDLKQNG